MDNKTTIYICNLILNDTENTRPTIGTETKTKMGFMIRNKTS